RPPRPHAHANGGRPAARRRPPEHEPAGDPGHEPRRRPEQHTPPPDEPEWLSSPEDGHERRTSVDDGPEWPAATWDEGVEEPEPPAQDRARRREGAERPDASRYPWDLDDAGE
ncbi:hypothetical protein QCN29_36410, partial [Streptomyces sp. HNM0663]|nr:hypothetical protein [Streptomyces chengmaiensis]